MRRSKVTIRIPQAVERGYIECPVWGCFDWAYPNSRLRRGRVQEKGMVSPAVTSNGFSVYEVIAVERW